MNSRVATDVQVKARAKRFFSNIKDYFNSNSGYRKKALRLDFTSEVISDEMFFAAKKNAEAVGGSVSESSYSAKNARSFSIVLPRGEDVVYAASRIIDEANRKMPSMVSASYIEKIDFVADLHMKLATLKPLDKLNDLTTQMLVNRVLIQLGLDPAVKVEADITMTREQVAQLYRNGIADYIYYTQKTFEVKKDDDGSMYVENEAASVTGRGAGLRVKITGKYSQKFARAAAILRAKGQVTPLDNRMIQLGKDRRNYVLKDDGFLYDGIVPHTIRNENGKLKLVPIADEAYRLLGLNGEFTGEDGVRREITAEHHALLKGNLESVENVLAGRLKPEDIEIVYDKNVIQSNKTGDLYLYDWQIPSLERAAKIKEDPKEDPYAVLVTSRGDPLNERFAGRTLFEQNYFKGTRGNKIGDVIGQYEQRDLDYNHLAREVKKLTNLPNAKKQKILADIFESRRKLHAAAREILRPFLTRLASLTPEEIGYLRENANFYQLEDFIRNFSKLAYESLDQAVSKMGDDYVYVQRVQSEKQTSRLGFLSQTERKTHPIVRTLTINGLLVPQLREIYDEMKSPAHAKEMDENGTIGKSIKQKIAAMAKGNKFAQGAMEEVVLRIYSKRAKDIQNSEEFESLFMNHYLHAVNRGSKEGISTTSDPTYLVTVKSYEQVAAVKLKEDDGLVKLFKEFRKDSSDPQAAAQQWLLDLAAREKKEKLPVEYYELSWVGAFSKEFQLPLETVTSYLEGNKANNDKFTQLGDGVIYVLKIPVEQIDANYASGYAGQFENTTRVGFGLMESKMGVIRRGYKGDQKYGVNLAGLNANAREVYDMATQHLESKADFTPYLVYSGRSEKFQTILAGLISTNPKVYDQSLSRLRSLKYDLKTIKSDSDWAGFKQLIEDAFNVSLKVAESKIEEETRKTMLEAVSAFIKEHAHKNQVVAGWALELWEQAGTVVKGQTPKYGKDILKRARSEASVYRRLLAIEEPEGK
jgi:hypothetical protein